MGRSFNVHGTDPAFPFAMDKWSMDRQCTPALFGDSYSQRTNRSEKDELQTTGYSAAAAQIRPERAAWAEHVEQHANSEPSFVESAFRSYELLFGTLTGEAGYTVSLTENRAYDIDTQHIGALLIVFPGKCLHVAIRSIPFNAVHKPSGVVGEYLDIRSRKYLNTAVIISNCALTPFTPSVATCSDNLPQTFECPWS